MIDEHVGDGDDGDQKAIADAVEMKNGEIHGGQNEGSPPCHGMRHFAAGLTRN